MLYKIGSDEAETSKNECVVATRARPTSQRGEGADFDSDKGRSPALRSRLGFQFGFCSLWSALAPPVSSRYNVTSPSRSETRWTVPISSRPSRSRAVSVASTGELSSALEQLGLPQGESCRLSCNLPRHLERDSPAQSGESTCAEVVQSSSGTLSHPPQHCRTDRRTYECRVLTRLLRFGQLLAGRKDADAQ